MSEASGVSSEANPRRGRLRFSERGPLVFCAGAWVNWLVTGGAVAAPAFVAPWIGLDDLHHTFLLRIWAGMAFLWGFMFREIARDLRVKKDMIKYAWLEKSVTAVSVTIAFAGDQVGWRCFALILFTDYLWIPLFFYYDCITRGNPPPEHVLAEGRATLGLVHSG